MRSSQRLPILILVLGLAAIIEVRAGEPEKLTAPPKTPGECRRLVLQEMAEFRKLKGPVYRDGDEHIARAAGRSFHEMQMQARIALAFAGDRNAVAELVKQFDLSRPTTKPGPANILNVISGSIRPGHKPFGWSMPLWKRASPNWPRRCTSA